jgi:hypothetical protein
MVNWSTQSSENYIHQAITFLNMATTRSTEYKHIETVHGRSPQGTGYFPITLNDVARFFDFVPVVTYMEVWKQLSKGDRFGSNTPMRYRD